MNTWKIKYVGKNVASGTLMGDPLVALMCARDAGEFFPAEDQSSGPPEGWLVGELVTKTKGARMIRARMIARTGGQLTWKGGFNSPGSRHFDFASWSGHEATIENAGKPATESWFASQLQDQGWEVVDEPSHTA